MSTTRSLVAMSAFSMAGNTPLVVQPMLLGAMVDLLGLSERQAGIVAAVELAGLTLGILGMISLMRRIPRWLIAVAAVALIVSGDLICCFVHSFAWLLPARFLCGTGAAAAFCVFLSLASSDEHPENVFAVVNAVAIAYSGVLTFLAPYLLQAAGIAGMLITLMCITSAALLTLPWVARHRTRPLVTPTKLNSLPSSVFPLLAMMLLLYIGHGAIWSYQERIGVAAGLDEHDIGKWLGLSMLVWGVAGSLLARVAGLSIGRMWPQVISLCTSFLAVLVLVYGSGSASFALSSGLIAFSWFYGLPYQMGLLAARDPQGRTALAGTMMSTGGMALGPAIAATVLVGSAHWPIGVFAGICYLAALSIAVPSARKLTVLSGPSKTELLT